MQEVFIKQFNNFSARKVKLLIKILTKKDIQKPFKNQPQPLNGSDHDKGKPLISAFKTAWKRQRLIMNPTFSTAKLKEMGPLFTKCLDRLIEKMNKDENLGEVNFHLYLKRFTMDTIWNCAFGLDIDLQNDMDNIYYEKSESVFTMIQNSKSKIIFASGMIIKKKP